ncbi:MAG: glycosyltransferase family 9 protein [Phycisphaerales bacterium]|nr:glycosyltransferase family 9 protein [Phycisphaerales bacterium]
MPLIPRTEESPANQRILIVRPSALGDVCRTVPVLASLRAAMPSAQIDWLVQDTFAPAIAHHPALSGLVLFPREKFGEQTRRGTFAPVLRWMKELKHRRYDLAIDCQGLARSGMFTWATRARRRIGYANAQEGAWLAYTLRERVDRSVHAVDRMLRLVQAAGFAARPDMRLYCDPEQVRLLEADSEIAGSRYVLVAPTSRWAGKRWPEERFIAGIEAMLGAGVERIVLVGSESERPQCAGLCALALRDSRVVNRIGATSIAGLMALVRGSAVVLCNDSAALHMAVGFDRPVVALYGPTLVSRVGPYRREGDVIQHVRDGDIIEHKDASAGSTLMGRIGVEEVLGAVLARYGQSTPTSPVHPTS